MKKIVLYILVWLIAGCAIYVVPLNDGRIPLPPASYGVEFNTYGSGWGWPFLRSPGVSWGHRGYYYGSYPYGYGWGPRWVPGHLKSVPEPNGIGRYIWVPGH